MNPYVRRPSLSPIRILSAALCLGVLYFTPDLKPQTRLLAASATATQPFDAINLYRPVGIGATGVFIGEDNPAFARADYDDSKWLAADDKTPLRQSIPNKQPEIVWQRIHVKVSPDDAGLGIESRDVARAFEIYVNGQKLLGAGQIFPLTSVTLGARRVARIQDVQIATGYLVIAIRERTSPSWWSQSSSTTFFAESITLGQETALADHAVLSVIYTNAFTWLVTLMGIGLCVVALALFITQRQQKEYLWLALQGVNWAISLAIEVTASYRNIPVGWVYVDALATELVDFFTMLMMFAFVRKEFNGWLRIYIVSCCLCRFAISCAYAANVPVPTWIDLLNAPHYAIFIFVIPAILIVHLRRGNREERFLLVPVISWGIGNALYGTVGLMVFIPGLRNAAIHLAEMTFSFAVGPFENDTSMVTTLIAFVSLTVIIVQRATRTSRQQTLLEGEIAAARQIQQIILPEQIETIPGFTIESVYQPAQQVGGDFFQVLPAGDGGLLLVLGDVAGKGLPAAMLVSVLVGAIRATAEHTHSPAAMLESLNERMIGRTRGGFSTALAAFMEADGRVVIANAGHLSPYLDGLEVELPGALPLGIVGDAIYETMEFQLALGSRITFYSDGVVEAQNDKRELFGFDRAKSVSTQPAAVIVETAKNFGQSDDITVVTIERVATVETAKH